MNPSARSAKFSLPDFRRDPEGSRELVSGALAAMPLIALDELVTALVVLAVTIDPASAAGRAPLTPEESEVLSLFANQMRETARLIAERDERRAAQRGLN